MRDSLSHPYTFHIIFWRTLEMRTEFSFFPVRWILFFWSVCLCACVALLYFFCCYFGFGALKLLLLQPSMLSHHGRSSSTRALETTRKPTSQCTPASQSRFIFLCNWTHTQQQQQRIRNFLRPYILQCIIAPCINTAVGDLSAAHKKYVAVDSVVEWEGESERKGKMATE